MSTLTGADIAGFLGRPLRGPSLAVAKPADLAECGEGDLVWVRCFSAERLAVLEARRPSLVIADAQTASRTTAPAVACENPRLAFVRVLGAFFAPPRPQGTHPTALVDPAATVGSKVAIGPYARIGPDVVLGDECVIGSGVAIEGRVTLGRRCVIKANSVLGGQGFGFEYDEAGRPVHFPHVGRIVLEDEVWIGACSTIELAALGVTHLGRGVKVDDLVQVGHNVAVGPNTLIMANAVICGGAVIGEGCWIAPNSVIKQKVRIGDRVTVGLGAVVLKDVADGLVVAGVPAKPLPAK